MVKIFKRVLFLAILGLVGFGVYTGISKLVDAIKAPKTATSVIQKQEEPKTTENTGIQKITTGNLVKTGIIKTGTMTIGTGKKANSGSNIAQTGLINTTSTTKEESGFFTHVWTTIKGWFTFGDSASESLVTTGSKIHSGKQITGAIASGEILNGTIRSTGTEMDEFIEDDGTGSISKTTTTTKSTSPSKTTTIQTTVTKKPATTTTKPAPTTNSEKDPVLDALF